MSSRSDVRILRAVKGVDMALEGLSALEAMHALIRAQDGVLKQLAGDRSEATATGVKPVYRIPRLGRARLFRLDRNREVRDFILEVAEYMTYREMEAAAVAKFGRARVPSHTAIYSYVTALRKEQERWRKEGGRE